MFSSHSQLWIIGKNGMLGQQLVRHCIARQVPFISTGRDDVDVADLHDVVSFANKCRPRWIINAAAFTAVDAAEREEEAAFVLNADAVYNLCLAAKKVDAGLVHISTDYVFDGKQQEPYRESDKTNPLSVYGRSKLAGEQHVCTLLERYFIFRISWLYGVYGENFVETIISLCNERSQIAIVSDQVGAPTYARTFAAQVVDFLVNNPMSRYGVYHYADAGECSWYTFAQAIYAIAQEYQLVLPGVSIVPQKTVDYPRPASRPASSRLATQWVQTNLSFSCYDWRDNLQAYFEERQALWQ